MIDFDELIASLNALGAAHPWLGAASALVALVAAMISVIIWLRKKFIGEAHRIRHRTEQENQRLKADLGILKGKLERLEPRLPEAAFEAARRERLDDNEELAIRKLRAHLATEGARLGEMSRQIAHFHLGQVSGPDPDPLILAERFALLAFHLDPRQGEAGRLLREVQALRDPRPFEHVQFTDLAATPAGDLGDGYGLAPTPAAVGTLITDSKTAWRRGRYLHALALADRAVLSARRWELGDREPLALAARHARAEALNTLGNREQALAEIDGSGERAGALRLFEEHPDLGPLHPNTLATRWLRALILVELGRQGEALAEIDGEGGRAGVLRLQEESPDPGPLHPNTLATRGLRARVLQGLGREPEALAEIDGAEGRSGLLGLREEILGPTHRETLFTRFWRAAILRDLGRDQDALLEIDGDEDRRGVIPIEEDSQDLGPGHPETLTARCLRASILDRLGRHEEARVEIDGTGDRPGVVAQLEQDPNVGPAHYRAMNAREGRAGILQSLGRFEDALAELDRGPRDALMESLRGAILHHLGRDEESEAVLRAAGDRQEEARGADHPLTLTTGHRLATTLVALGRADEAEGLLQSVVEGRRARLGEAHPNTRAAVSDLARLRGSRGDKGGASSAA